MPTGLSGSFGVALEEEYGVYQAPENFIEVESFGVARKATYLTSRPLRGRPGIPAARHRETTRMAEGSIAIEVPSKGLGALLNLLHGETVAPEKQGESKAYKQTHALGVTSPNGKSLTLQANIPNADADQPFTFIGSKFTSVSFSCDTSGQLKASFDAKSRDALTAEELAEPSYPDPIRSYGFDQAAVKIGSETVTESGLIIHSFNLSIPLPMKDERYGLGQGGVQAEPIGFNDSMLPTLELACEFTNMDLYNHYVNGDEEEITISFKGEKIESTYYEEIGFVFPGAKFVGSGPELSGPDLVDQTASIEIYDTITKALSTITYQSTDTALY